MEQQSIKAKNEILLKAKTNPFKINLQQTENKINQKSILTGLIGKHYSTNGNKNFTLLKNSKTENNFNDNKKIKRNDINDPQKSFQEKKNQAFEGLEKRAQHISNYAELNTNLLHEKAQYEQYIRQLKALTAKEKRLLNQANYNSHKNQNDIDQWTSKYKSEEQRSKKLQRQINLTKHENDNLTQQNNNLNQKNEKTQQNIKKQSQNCLKLEDYVISLKKDYLCGEKIRNDVKFQLIKNQKLMDSFAIQTKQLEDQRSMVLLLVNKSVTDYKL